MKEAIDFLKSSDEILKSIHDNFGDPIIQYRDHGYASMCHIILEQQVSIASAKACYQKIEDHFGAITPQIIAAANDSELRACGVSRQKASYLKDLAEKVNSGILDFATFPNKSEAEIRTELLQVKGVGNWSIEVYLMFCLQSPDIIPLGDIAIKNTIKELYQCHSLEEMTALSENWKPYRSVATYLLWHYYLQKRIKPTIRRIE